MFIVICFHTNSTFTKTVLLPFFFAKMTIPMEIRTTNLRIASISYPPYPLGYSGRQQYVLPNYGESAQRQNIVILLG